MIPLLLNRPKELIGVGAECETPKGSVVSNPGLDLISGSDKTRQVSGPAGCHGAVRKPHGSCVGNCFVAIRIEVEQGDGLRDIAPNIVGFEFGLTAETTNSVREATVCWLRKML